MNLPELKDFTEFTPPEDDLDGFHAWKQFGGLTVAEAYTKFLERPDLYQEDFMMMGSRAFLFYFPVIDRYIREVEDPVNRWDEEAWIIACGITNHFEEEARTLSPIRARVEELCNFALESMSQLSEGDTFMPLQQIRGQWERAKAAVLAGPDSESQ